MDGKADFHPDIPLLFPAASLPLCQWRCRLQTRCQAGLHALAPAGMQARVLLRDVISGYNKWM